MFTPAITASRVSRPAWRYSIAFRQARSPLPLEITMLRGAPCASPLCDAAASAADPNRYCRLLTIVVLASGLLYTEEQ